MPPRTGRDTKGGPAVKRSPLCERRKSGLAAALVFIGNRLGAAFGVVGNVLGLIGGFR